MPATTSDAAAPATRGRVLVVEDDAALSDVVCTFLGKAGFSCVPAFSGTEARMLVEAAAAGGRGTSADATPGPAGTAGPGGRGFDLVVCDLMLPGLPGDELVGVVRERLGAVPVIVTSARAAVGDRVALLRCGADDYLVKPFDLEELLARIEVQLRIHGAGAPAGDAARAAGPALRLGAWELSPETREFHVGGRELRLTRTEFDMLAAMMRQPSRVFTKRDLYLASCHGDALADATAAGVSPADERTVSTHVANLRAKLRPTGTDGCLRTVWGIGFKLEEPAAGAVPGE